MSNEIDILSNLIRTMDPEHKMGAGALAETIVNSGWMSQHDMEVREETRSEAYSDGYTKGYNDGYDKDFFDSDSEEYYG